MAYFIFKVKNSKGEIIQGSCYAENLSEAALKLEQKDYTLLEIKEKVEENIPAQNINVSVNFS